MSFLQCESITQSNNRCSRNSKNNSKYCWQHQQLKYESKEISINELLDYKYINKLYEKYKKELKFDDQKLPFSFNYDFVFIGLQFEPFTIKEYKINTIDDLVILYFKLSLIEYTNNKNLFNELYDILIDLKKYRNFKYLDKCSSPQIYIRSNYQYTDVSNFEQRDLDLLCNIYDIPIPDVDIIKFLNTF